MCIRDRVSTQSTWVRGKIQQKKGLGGLGGLMKTEILAAVQLTTKYNIFLEPAKSDDEPFELILEMPNESTVDDCILQSVQLFNKKIIEQQLLLQQLSKNIQDYCLYNANKKGKRKEDLPAMEGSQILQNTHIYRFVLVQLKPQVVTRPQQANSHYLDFEKFEKNQQQMISKQKEQDQQIEEETCCLCFKIKKKK
eukprot:TRINITY_DN13887_c0_g1_i2.p1 TRINITY_DN13887_c0_g1~~TRINITY_DN13887_c0_g1_i2.p1  ORF type:complete len:195 (+),score=40.05 TRINITY_DN13887_c0_g1_i2:99-683(+)